MSIKPLNRKVKNLGFTLIEMLISVSIIGILAGVTIKIIDSTKQQQRAQDATRSHQLKEVVEVLETYYVTERHYPPEGAVNNPLDPSVGDERLIVSGYLSLWPENMIYNISSEANPSERKFEVHIQKATDPKIVYKYYSEWQEIRECSTDLIKTNPAQLQLCD